MIISEKNRYLFVETPHTGSTAISKELCEKYGGKEILRKHSNYHEFLKVAQPEQKDYFVFAGTRNPLDEAVSLYSKFLTDHKGNYTKQNKKLEHGGWVTKRKIEIYNAVQSNRDFNEFLRKFYRRVYTSNININKKHCDYIMRFESLDDDFSSILKKLGIKQKRPLPKVNKTKKKGNFEDYYNSKSMDYAVKVFGPFMEEWSYNFPEDWPSNRVPQPSRLLYKFAKLGRLSYSKHVKSGPLKRATAVRSILE